MMHRCLCCFLGDGHKGTKEDMAGAEAWSCEEMCHSTIIPVSLSANVNITANLPIGSSILQEGVHTK